MSWTPSQSNGWWPKLSPDGAYVGYGNWTVWYANLATGVETQVTTKGFPAGWWDATHFCYSEKISDWPPGSADDEYRRLMQVDVTTGTISEIATNYALLGGNTCLADDGHWASWLALTNRVSYDNALLAAAYDVALSGEWLVTSRVSDGHLFVYQNAVLSREIVPPGSPGAWRVSNLGDVAFTVGTSIYVSLADGTMLNASRSGYSLGEFIGPLIYQEGTLWLWSVGQTEAADDILFGRPVSEQPSQVYQVNTRLLHATAAVTTNSWVIAGTSNVGILTVETIPFSSTNYLLSTQVTGGYPPLNHPVVDAKLHKATRPWAMWFQEQANTRIDLGSASVTGSLPLSSLASQPASTLVGRGAGSAGPPGTIYLGSGLEMVGTTLRATAASYYEPLSTGTIPDNGPVPASQASGVLTEAAPELVFADGDVITVEVFV